MGNNRDKVREAWSISKKYTDILMYHEKNNEHLDMFSGIYCQFLHELKNKKIEISLKQNYIQCWKTVINTINNNPKINIQKAALKLLHQTSIQRSYKNI